MNGFDDVGDVAILRKENTAERTAARTMETPSIMDMATPQTSLAMDSSPTKSSMEIPNTMDLAQLVETLERELEREPELAIKYKPKIQQLLESFPVNMEELQRFAHFDPSRNYTRNLISTDNETYALMLLCWNPGKYSPVHDHPTDGCWVKVIQGHVNEVRYEKQNDKLVETSNVVFTSGVTYMDDSLGLHKVGNPQTEINAISMHLYSPPYEKCRVWFDTEKANQSSVSVANYYTEYGEKVEYS